MAENASKPKTKKIILCVVCVALILVVAFVGIYYLNPPESQSKATDVVTNFSDGAWLKTKIVSYDDTGTVIDGQGYQTSNVKSGTYDGKACWILTENYTFTYTNGTIRDDFVAYYIDKSTNLNLHYSIMRMVDGVVQFDESYYPGSEGFDDDLLFYGNMTVSAVSEVVQVPAGTFDTTVHTKVFDETDDAGLCYSIWMSKDVPIWGVVKSRYYIGNLTVCDYMLESYGR